MWKLEGHTAVVALVMCGTVTLGAQNHVPSFDADVLTFYKSGDGRVVSTSVHFYRGKDGQTRQDTSFGAVITDLTAKSVTLLNFKTKQALVFDMKDMKPVPAATKSEHTTTSFGRTSLEGYQAIKAKGVGPRGEKVEVWTAESIKAVVFTRTETPGMTMTRYLRNITVREADPAVFAVPHGYSVTRQAPPPGFDPAKSIEFPGVGRGRGLLPGTGRGSSRGGGG